MAGVGADINERGSRTNSAALDVASPRGYVEVLVFLLHHGAELDVSDTNRNPPFAAIDGQHVAATKLLNDRGLDTNVNYAKEPGEVHDALTNATKWERLKIAQLVQDSRAVRASE